ncbi:MAG: hypothetical protein QJR08_10135 [Bacillota bacterium]|nr:hypothetical protein [Bacillota bacterium]
MAVVVEEGDPEDVGRTLTAVQDMGEDDTSVLVVVGGGTRLQAPTIEPMGRGRLLVVRVPAAQMAEELAAQGLDKGRTYIPRSWVVVNSRWPEVWNFVQDDFPLLFVTDPAHSMLFLEQGYPVVALGRKGRDYRTVMPPYLS